MISESGINDILDDVTDPENGKSLKSNGQLRSVESLHDGIRVEIALTSWSAPLRETLGAKITERVKQRYAEVSRVEITWVELDRPPLVANTIGLNCKSVIAVAAGKGGVGKSTLATCLALALKRLGSRVGLLDADVYGPSIPQLTGTAGHPSQIDGKIQPIDYDGMPVLSIGFIVPPDQAVIWRGPRLHVAITQFLRDTAWGSLDYLIIDLPPGTGDVALTLSQLIPMSGVVIVCTPQKVALLDAIKAVGMFEKVRIPVLGVVENMSTFVCPDNGKRYDIFGSGGAHQYADDAGLPFLGEVPIHIPVRQRGDLGNSADNLNDPIVAPYLMDIARHLTQVLAEKSARNPPRPSLPVIG